jgi:hypothetical protein
MLGTRWNTHKVICNAKRVYDCLKESIPVSNQEQIRGKSRQNIGEKVRACRISSSRVKHPGALSLSSSPPFLLQIKWTKSDRRRRGAAATGRGEAKKRAARSLSCVSHLPSFVLLSQKTQRRRICFYHVFSITSAVSVLWPVGRAAAHARFRSSSGGHFFIIIIFFGAHHHLPSSSITAALQRPAVPERSSHASFIHQPVQAPPRRRPRHFTSSPERIQLFFVYSFILLSRDAPLLRIQSQSEVRLEDVQHFAAALGAQRHFPASQRRAHE